MRDEYAINGQDQIYPLLAGHGIHYHPSLKKYAGSANAAIVLSQLLFWHGKGARKEEFYKTYAELGHEVGLSVYQVTEAVKLLTLRKLVEHSVKQIPATSHYKVQIKFLINWISGDVENTEQLAKELHKRSRRNRNTITKNTQRSLQETSEKGGKMLDLTKIEQEDRDNF